MRLRLSLQPPFPHQTVASRKCPWGHSRLQFSHSKAPARILEPSSVRYPPRFCLPESCPPPGAEPLAESPKLRHDQSAASTCHQTLSGASWLSRVCLLPPAICPLAGPERGETCTPSHR